MQKCRHCNSEAIIKYGKTKNGTQIFFCKECRRRSQEKYSYNSYLVANLELIKLVKEGLGIRSISRILKISSSTVIKRIKRIARSIKRKTEFTSSKEYEIDELATFVSNKNKRVWITYAIRKDTREVIDFRIGNRSKKTMRPVITSVLLLNPKKVYTDRFPSYRSLIPFELHCFKKRDTNYIERKNLTLRTHLKRLNRKTICYSKTSSMLEASLKIYFWS